MRTRQGETICLGERIRPASADFPPVGGVWGGMRAGFGTLFPKTNFEFCFSKCVAIIFCLIKFILFGKVIVVKLISLVILV